MPLHLSRFQSGPGGVAGPCQHQVSGLTPTQSNNYPLQLGSNSHLNPNAQIPSFATNGNVLSLGSGMSSATSFGVGPAEGLASHAARMGFHGAAALQQQQQHAQQQGQSTLDNHPARNMAKRRIKDVWSHNLEQEMAVLRKLVEKYPYIAMDTEFPGVVARPMGGFRGKSDYHYQCLRANVDLLKVIQIGITLFNEEGETPGTRSNATDNGDSNGTGRRNAGHEQLPHAWQFNFNFSIEEDMYNLQSIESLQQAGIDFKILKRDGIDPKAFAALLIPSGLTFFDEVKWISFHGGYDFGYLTKLLLCKPLPKDEHEFEAYMKKIFPSTYDVKHLMKHAIKLHNSGMLTPSDAGTTELLQKFEQKSGLESIADALKIKRVGSAHQAGSDSLLTGKVFFAMRDKVFRGEIASDHVGKIWGLGVPDITIPSQYQVASLNSGPDNIPLQTQNSGHNGGTPSTPNTGTAGLVQTPAAHAHNTNGSTGGPLTPGGVFGNFQMNPSSR